MIFRSGKRRSVEFESLRTTLSGGKVRPSGLKSGNRRGRDARRLARLEHLESRQMLATVGIFAQDPTASEPGTDFGLFRVLLSEAGMTNTTVQYAIGGTASNGVDYTSLSGFVTIQAGSFSATIPVNVIDDTLLEPTETVVLTLTGTDKPDVTVDPQANRATVNIADNEVNAPPAVTTNTGSTVAEGGADVITANELRSSDPDTPAGKLVYTVTAGPSNGTVRLGGAPTSTFTQADINAGTVTYQHNGSETISDAFTFSISDGLTTRGGNSFNFTVTPVNDAPTVVNPIPDQTVAEESNPTMIGISAVFADADPGDKLTFSASSGNSLIVNATISSDGKNVVLTYLPNQSGVTSVTVTATDQAGAKVSDEFVVNVTNTNDPVDAKEDAFTTPENQAITGNVLTNDVDPDNLDQNPANDVLTATLLSATSKGTLSFNTNGSFTYTPNPNFFGADTFIYRAFDGKGTFDDATVTITVNNINQPPNAGDDAFTTVRNTPVSGNVLVNDNDPDNDQLLTTLETLPPASQGTVVLQSNGNFTFTPAFGFLGTTSFRYLLSDGQGGTDSGLVTITVTPGANLDAGDDFFTQPEDTVVTGNLLANDIDPNGDSFSLVSTTPPSSGSVTVDAAGNFTYTPIANFFGTDSFTYTIQDTKGFQDTATVTLTFTPVNDVDARDDVFSALQGTALNVQAPGVLANDIDPDTNPSDQFPITGVIPFSGTTSKGGAVTVNANGSFSYTSAANFTGADTFPYTIADTKGATDTATVTINVGDRRNPPDARDDTASTGEDIAVQINVLANDIDADGDKLTVIAVGAAANGQPSLGAGGVITYQPNANFVGVDSFTYTISDSTGLTDTAKVTVNVFGRNVLSANNDSFRVLEDTIRNPLNVLANDVDPEGDAFKVTAVTQGSKGVVEVGPNGTNVLYTPDPNFSGIDMFTYTITDATGQTDSATVTVTVDDINERPNAVDDTASAIEDGPPTVINVLANDTDPEFGVLKITAVTQGKSGTVAIRATGLDLVYQPNPNFFGTDTFTYTVTNPQGNTDTATVTVTVADINDVPDAKDDTAVVLEDSGSNFIDVLANDTDIDGDKLFVSNITPPANGTVTIVPGFDDPDPREGGGVIYMPNPNFVGVDPFTYTVSDGRGGTDSATVTVIVSGRHDVPSPVDDKFTATEDATITLIEAQLVTNDFNPNVTPAMIASVLNPVGGTVVLNPDRSVTFDPNPDFTGNARFEYTLVGGDAKDTGLVTITFTPVNEVDAKDDTFTTPIGVAVFFGSRGVLANDVDPEGDAITKATVVTGPTNGTLDLNPDGSFTYKSNPGFIGTDSFTYTAFDWLGASDIAKATINVIDAPPAPRNDLFSVQEGSDQNFIDVLGDDTDPEGKKLRIVAVTQGRNGKVTIVPGGLVYTPNPGFVGIDEFTYTVSDEDGDINASSIAVALVTLFVHGSGVTYFPMPDDFTRPEDTVITLMEADLLSNDYNPTKASVDLASVSNATDGSVNLNLDGSVNFTPNPNFAGIANFNYKGTLGSTMGLVTIDFTPIQDLPVAGDDTTTVNEETGVKTIDVLANDADSDGDALLISAITQGAQGSVAIGGGGTNVLYTPGLNFVGTDIFSYTVSDGNGGTDTAVVTVVAVESELVGSAFGDVFYLRLDGAGLNVQVFDNDTASGPAIFTNLLGSLPALSFDALDGDDRLIVDFINGNPLPVGGIYFLAGANGSAGDQLTIRNGASALGTYAASSTTTGNGVVTIGARNINMTGVEPIDVSDLLAFTVITPNANDTLTLTNAVSGTDLLTGTSGGVALSNVMLTDVATTTINAAANDAGAGNDVLTITATGPLPSSSGSLVYLAGTGTNTLTVQGGTTSINSTTTGTGTLDTTVAAAAELITSRFVQRSLILGAGSRAEVVPGGPNVISVLDTLTVAGTNDAWTGQLDLNNSDLKIQSTTGTKAADFARLYNQLRQGFAGGTWSGNGIISSTAATNVNTDTGLSLVDNALLGYTTFTGEPVNADSLLFKYTYYGDIDQNGQVDADDLTVFANNFGMTVGATQVDGDIDFNGTVDADDLTVFANNFLKGVGTPLTASARPENVAPRVTAPLATLSPGLRPGVDGASVTTIGDSPPGGAGGWWREELHADESLIDLLARAIAEQALDEGESNIKRKSSFLFSV